ncbi:MAG: hypothetical protein RIS47_1604 [Bacteroidota bacterium]|jgi:ribonuclease Z
MGFTLTVLGTGSALPTPSRFSTAQVLNVNERFFLLDCGEGTQIQLKKYGINTSRITHIFISHLHGDHIFGLFGLLSSMSLTGRKVPLTIFSIEELKPIIDACLGAYRLDYEIKYTFFSPNVITTLIDDRGLEVISFPVSHRAPTVGFRFKEKQKEYNVKKTAITEFGLTIKDIISIKQGNDYTTPEGNVIRNANITNAPKQTKSYAFVTDTSYDERIIPIVKGVDLLYHESTFTHESLKMARMTTHSTALQAGMIARRAQVKNLLLGHFSQRYKDTSVFLKEAQLEFQQTRTAFDGMRIEI